MAVGTSLFHHWSYDPPIPEYQTGIPPIHIPACAIGTFCPTHPICLPLPPSRSAPPPPPPSHPNLLFRGRFVRLGVMEAENVSLGIGSTTLPFEFCGKRQAEVADVLPADPTKCTQPSGYIRDCQASSACRGARD